MPSRHTTISKLQISERILKLICISELYPLYKGGLCPYLAAHILHCVTQATISPAPKVQEPIVKVGPRSTKYILSFHCYGILSCFHVTFLYVLVYGMHFFRLMFSSNILILKYSVSKT